MKKIRLVLLAVFAAVLCFATTALAEEAAPQSVKPGHPVCIGTTVRKSRKSKKLKLFSSNKPSGAFLFDAVKDYIIEEHEKHSECICIQDEIERLGYRDIGILPEEFCQYYVDMLLRDYKIMAVTECAVTIFVFVDDNYEPIDGIEYIEKLYPLYLNENKEQDDIALDKVDKKLQEYEEDVKNIPDDLGKLAVLHDKIIYDFKYDINNGSFEHTFPIYDYEGNPCPLLTTSEYKFSDYHLSGLINNKNGVCQAYSQLFYTMCQRLGFDVDFCTSDIANHTWNLVKLNGKWYHIDVTQDDPIVFNDNKEIIDRTTAMHRYFLVPDSVIADSAHANGVDFRFPDGSAVPVCSDDSYLDNYLFNNKYDSTIKYIGNNYCTMLYDEDGEPYDFKYSTLFTGPVLASEIKIDKKDGKRKYAYIIAKGDESIYACLIVKKSDGTIYNANLNSQEYPINTFMNCTIEDCFKECMLWDLATLKPLAKKVIIN